MKLTLKLKNDLKTVRAALAQVQHNQEYQQRTGGKWFTSAPTEYEWKEREQKLTDEAVLRAMELLDNILFPLDKK